MDPTTALESLLAGHMMVDHVEALREWMAFGGFPPAPVWLPFDCAPCFARLPSRADITVSHRGMLVQTHCDVGTGEHDYRVAYTWNELHALAIANDFGNVV